VPPLLLLLALVGVVALLLLIPTRRLFLAGWSQRTLVLYFLGMLVLGLLVAELRGPARFLVPILIIGYVAPFAVASEGMARLLGRQPRRPVVKDVTPPPTLIEGSSRRVGDPEDDGDPTRGAVPASRAEAPDDRPPDDRPGSPDDRPGSPDDRPGSPDDEA
jgi:hypothetical protein